MLEECRGRVRHQEIVEVMALDLEVRRRRRKARPDRAFEHGQAQRHAGCVGYGAGGQDTVHVSSIFPTLAQGLIGRLPAHRVCFAPFHEKTHLVIALAHFSLS
jgi:hypothetical protein